MGDVLNFSIGIKIFGFRLFKDWVEEGDGKKKDDEEVND